MSAPSVRPRPQFVRLLYSHNPFYVISALLMLFAVRTSYGEISIGTINCWAMMSVLAGYTSLLAIIAVLVIRWGEVWEDARSILVILLLLFLAVSVSADDLFVNMETQAGGVLLLLVGCAFCALVTELVLRFSRIRLGLSYRITLHAMYVLFYAAPWACSSILDDSTSTALEWRIFLFPVVAAGILLMLFPAVRRGPGDVADNGTPWGWPLFPWTAFLFIVIAVAFRSFALAMTYGPSGPIWVHLKSGQMLISFDTMWGPYFLIPPALAMLLLWLEAGFTLKSRAIVRRVLLCAPMLLVMALPFSRGAVFRGFLSQLTVTLGSPLWMTTLLLMSFYGWAWFRQARGARVGALVCALLLTIIGPQTLDFATLTEPQPIPLLGVGLLLLVMGLRQKWSLPVFAACTLLTTALWLTLPETLLARFRMTGTYHVLWLSVIAIGLMYRDRFARLLRFVGAVQMPVTAALAFLDPIALEVPANWRIGYVAVLTLLCLTLAMTLRSHWYLYAFVSLLAVGGYGGALFGFGVMSSRLGRTATTAFAWSTATLLMAVLISTHKAGGWPRRMLPRWDNDRWS